MRPGFSFLCRIAYCLLLYLQDVARLVWRAQKYRMLSRKVVSEKDIDDGTFTTVHKVQVADIFKRLKITDEKEIDGIIEGIQVQLRRRIRDSKRVFAFYAASGDFGSVTDMDRGEYWKFVKDCHFQKDRKLLPSVRVDLIFQKACMDKSLEGKARSMSAVDEIGPPTWIECLVRICSWKFRNNKKKFVDNFK